MTTVAKRGLSMDEACVYIGGISRPTMYKLMNEGLKSYVIGSRRYFLVSVLDEYLEQQHDESSRQD